MKNRYFYRSRLNDNQFRKIIECFTNDLTAITTAKLTKINRNTINNIFKLVRARRVLGKRGRGAAGKTPVFGLLKRNGNMYI